MDSGLFTQYYIKRIYRYFKENSFARVFTVVAMLSVFSLIGWGVFAFAYSGFEFTQTEEFLAEVAPLYMYEVFIMVIGFLIFISAIISGIFTFFRKQGKDVWVASTPSYESLSWIGFVKVVFGASWPFILVAVPMLLAAQSFFNISFNGFLFSFMAVFAFSVFSAALGVLVVFASAYLSLLFSHRVNRFKVMVFFALVFVAFFGALVWDGLVNVDFAELFQVDDMEIAVATSERIIDNFKYYPSHLPAFTMYSAEVGNTADFVNYSMVSLLLMFVTVLVYVLVNYKYLKLWQVFSEGGFEARKKTPSAKDGKILYFLTKDLVNLKSLNTPSRVLFKKELLVNTRTMKNVLWMGFLAILMFLQIALVAIIGERMGAGDLGEAEHVVPALQFAVIIFFIGAFALRFVFPSFSQEGSASWILGSAPIKLKEVFFQKMKFYLMLNSLLGLLAVTFFFVQTSDAGIGYALLGIVLNFPWLVFLVSVLIFSSAITVIGLSLGVVFVNFKIDDPQLMSTSLPGMFVVLVFLVFGFLGGVAMYQFFAFTAPVFLLLLNTSMPVFAGVAILHALKSIDKLELGA